MKRSKLRNKFLKDRTETTCSKLFRSTKKSCYSGLDLKKVTNNKAFWRIITPLFTKSPLKCENINLAENGKNFSNNTHVWKIFNCFSCNIVSEHNFSKQNYVQRNLDSESDLSLSSLLKILQVLRILNIKKLIQYLPERLLTLMQ